MVDSIVIPDLKKLLYDVRVDRDLAEEAMQLYRGARRAGRSGPARRIASHPEMDKAIPPTKATQWRTPHGDGHGRAAGRYMRAREQLAVNIAVVMADNRLDAIVHKTVEIPPIPIAEAMKPPFNRTGNNYIASLNTFLVFAASITVPSGFSDGGLPAGITFFGPALHRADAAQTRVRLRTGHAPSRATEDHASAGEDNRVEVERPRITPGLSCGDNRERFT